MDLFVDSPRAHKTFRCKWLPCWYNDSPRALPFSFYSQCSVRMLVDKCKVRKMKHMVILFFLNVDYLVWSNYPLFLLRFKCESFSITLHNSSATFCGTEYHMSTIHLWFQDLMFIEIVHLVYWIFRQQIVNYSRFLIATSFFEKRSSCSCLPIW